VIAPFSFNSCEVGAASVQNARYAFGGPVLLSILLGALVVWPAARWAQAGFEGNESAPAARTLKHPRIVIIKREAKLYLFDGDGLIRTYPVKLGADPRKPKRAAGDGRTPEGRFRICTKNPASPFHRFLGIDYPDVAAAARGLTEGLISSGEGAAIYRAHKVGDCPPWSTGLGGGIGLHGAAESLERTAGCVALSDRHIEELFGVLRIGDTVEILP